MMKHLLPLLLLLPQAQDDPQKRVRALVEQLQADEIQTVDDAVASLIALGAPALEAIQAELKRAGGDTRLRLEETVRKIGRNVRRAQLLGAPVLVTLDVKEQPIADALEALRKASAQPLVFKELPAGKVSVAFTRLCFWEALDRLCKVHGGVMWEVSEKEIVVSKRPYRDLPKVFRGNHVVLFERLSSDLRVQPGASHPSVSLDGLLAWTRGAEPPRETLVLEEFKDDRGTDLREAAGNPTISLGGEEVIQPGHLGKVLDFTQTAQLDEKAEKIARLKGVVRLEYVLESRTLVTLAKPAGMVGKPQRVGGLTVTLKKFSADDEDASATVSIENPNFRDKLIVRARGFRLIDTKGVAHPASGWINEDGDEDTGKVEYDCDLDFTLPEGTQIAALEVSLPIDLEEIVIPFDFKDIPLK